MIDADILDAPGGPDPADRPRRRWWRWGPALRLPVATYAVTQGVLLFWWVAFWPGTLSYDSVMYVWQVSTSNWTTQHSVLYNAFVWLSLRATGGLSVLTLLQTVAMAAGLAYAVTGLRRLRVPGRWLAVAAVLVTCLPMVGTFTVYVSKDVAFAITQVWLLGTVARLVPASAGPRHRDHPDIADLGHSHTIGDQTTRPRPRSARLWEWVRARGVWLALAAEFVLMGLFRQNGFVVIGLTAAGLAIVLSGQRWRVIACGAAAIAVGFTANLAVYPTLGVKPVGPELVWGPAYADIAVAYSHRPDDFTAADRRVMASVAPLAYWAKSANCYNADSTVTYGNDSFDFAAARAHQGELVDLWLRLIKRMPEEMVSTRLCRGAIAWNPFPGPASGRTVKVPIAGVERYFNFPPERVAQSPYAGAVRLSPLSASAHDAAVFLRHLSDTRSFEWFAWRGSTWCYVAYLAVILFARRSRNLAVLGLVAVVAANQLNVLVNNPGQLVRYMAGPLIIGVLLLPLAFVPRARLAPPLIDHER